METKMQANNHGILKLNRRRVLAGLASVPFMTMGSMLAHAESARDDYKPNVSRNYNVKPQAPTESRVVEDFRVRPMLAQTSELRMQAAISRYEEIVSRGGWPRIPKVKTLVAGSKGKVVSLLRSRLHAEGYLPDSVATGNTYDINVEAAVRRFQTNNGLRAHGRVDVRTRNALAISAADRLDTLMANLPRIKAYAEGLGSRYIVVNIPAAQLDAIQNGQVRSRHNVVVGKVDRPSPVLMSKVSELNFNPYWNAPVSIVEKDIIPKVRKNRAVLKQMDIRIYDGYKGPEVDPSTIDWNNVSPDRYHFRQEPGQGNAMASVKINFPNKHAVYMHDTPTKQLFTEAARYFSSGCIRVDKVHILTNWILNGQEGWDRGGIDAVVNSGERVDVKVPEGPQIRFAYLTGWASDDGQVHFREDIYKLDGTGFIVGQPDGLPGEQAS